MKIQNIEWYKNKVSKINGLTLFGIWYINLKTANYIKIKLKKLLKKDIINKKRLAYLLFE